MLAGKAPRRRPAQAVRPDEVIHEVRGPKQIIEHQAQMMACPPVAVDKDRAVGFQHTSDGIQSRAQEVEVVVQVRPSVVVRAVGGGERSAGVERRIDVRQVHDGAG